jgi:hypothetical protein
MLAGALILGMSWPADIPERTAPKAVVEGDACQQGDRHYREYLDGSVSVYTCLNGRLDLSNYKRVA